MTEGSGCLLAVLANEPATTSGDRTRRRVATATNIIGCTTTVIINLFSVPTATVSGISVAGVEESAWLAARADISDGLRHADAILLAWGCTEPSGAARAHHRSQVAWLVGALSKISLPVWTVGGVPRHPSRWQRYTSRAYPSLAFNDALENSLTRDHIWS
jgi:hypothetical protein